jgi:hypothetical protein
MYVSGIGIHQAKWLPPKLKVFTGQAHVLMSEKRRNVRRGIRKAPIT